MQWARIGFCFCLCLFLAACGFHLRGMGPIPTQIKILYIEADNPYSPLILELKQQLRAEHIHLVDDPTKAPLTLRILKDSLSQQLATVSLSTQVKRYLLSYNVVFELAGQSGQVIYGPAAVAASSNYDTSDQQLLADTDLLTTQKNQMTRELLTQLFYRLNSQEARRAIAQHQT